MSGNLYQLRSSTKRLGGSYFYIGGPHDTHGSVIKSEAKKDPHGKKYFLNLIRGGAEYTPKEY